jgi:hypothetical protein
MIDELDEVLRQLLIRELPVKNGEVDIAFNQPKREWSARVSRPTLNLFLYDLRENSRLRQPSPAFDVERSGTNTAVQKRRALRMDLFYMITAWATEPTDEHRLLSRTIMALSRFGTLPDDLLTDGLKDQPAPITLSVAQSSTLEKPTDLWGVLDNEVHPAFGCMLTMALNPFTAIETPVVRTAEVRFGQSLRPVTQTLDAPDGEGRFVWICGQVRPKGKKPLANVRLTLVERGVEAPVQADGTFVLGILQAGTYTLEVAAEGRKPGRYTITVPSRTYDIDF